MFDVIIHPPISGFDGTNILLACLAGHLTIFAFGYPYVYRSVNNLSNISAILTQRVKNNKWRKFYSIFIITIFISNLIVLFFSNIKIISALSCGFLFLHILYVMNLYQIIENVTIDPFETVVNNNIHDVDSTIQVPFELENDSILVIELICYATKNTINEDVLKKYFTWLIDATFHIFNEYDIKNFNNLLGILPKEQETVFSTLLKIQWLNQWAVSEKQSSILDWINNFYAWVLLYGINPPKNFNNEAHPILSEIENTKILDANYDKTTDNLIKNKIYKQYNFIKRIQNNILESYKYSLLYRIDNHFLSYNEMFDFIDVLYFILSNKIDSKLNGKYEPCFNIITRLIDNNMFDKNYPNMFERIKKHHDYAFGESHIYGDICKFHISIMAYLIFRNQYELLKKYMNYEESKDRISQHARPQIPNSIDNILWNFIGHDSVFQTNQTFSANTSSYKYKFYDLFLLLMYSKQFADDYKEILSKLNKDDWRYETTERDINYHSKCSIDFKNMNFDIVMLYHSIENYKEFFEKFKQETELLNLFEFDSKDEQFITYILNNTIKQIKLAQKNLLKCKFKYIALKNFSIIKQEELGCKTLDEFINSKIHKFLETVENIPFKGKDNNLLKKTFWNVYEKTFSKRKILSGGYSYLFAGEPNKDFYSRLFSFIVENCQKIDDIKNIPSNIENYKILSNFDYKRNFENFGFNKNNIKVKKTIVNGIETDNFEHADVSSVIINDREIKISQCNDNFHFLNINDTNSHLLILFNPEKITIQIGNLQPIRYEDLEDGQVKIIDDTLITISIPEDKSLGYYILKKKS